VAADRVSFPLLAAIWRAPLGSVRYSLHLVEPTGVGKTELAALAQQHYGSTMSPSRLPAAWSATANPLEALAFEIKDAILVVDDFVPSGSSADVQGTYESANRLLRAQGNRAGRRRLNPDGTLQAAKPPRALIFSTGEDVPPGQSLRARMILIEVARDDVDWRCLGQCKKDAANDLYAQAMAAYVKYVAGKSRGLWRLQDSVGEEVMIALRHRRVSDNLKDLWLALHIFLDFAVGVGAISKTERETLKARGDQALVRLAEAQEAHQESSEPAGQFLRLLRSALVSGRAHVTNAEDHGLPPESHQAWGWRGPQGSPQGERIGWLDGGNLYLDPEASFAVAQKLAKDSGTSIPVSLSTLKKRLKQQGWLASVDKTRQTLTTRKTLEGHRRSVLHLTATGFLDGEPTIVGSGSDSGQAGPDNLTTTCARERVGCEDWVRLVGSHREGKLKHSSEKKQQDTTTLVSRTDSQQEVCSREPDQADQEVNTTSDFNRVGGVRLVSSARETRPRPDQPVTEPDQAPLACPVEDETEEGAA